ncbi:ankyrin repeat domain-containing protein 53 [Plakobranchus ocellatus]|uniref:Ankyrin repeat domain-containing protein 53 n=1 Tax=Plakobranchus ocellatus TaxID=259542 RepID=A0AAV4E1S9_9GAST|nr:ankyrin repeat domain-containing protein 53 [Plakobranchus ocellatus]
MPDNCNRYPLHYACSLPDEQSREFVRVLLEKNPEQMEKTMDKDGVYPAEYLAKRDSAELQQMLMDARTLDAYGREGPLLATQP